MWAVIACGAISSALYKLIKVQAPCLAEFIDTGLNSVGNLGETSVDVAIYVRPLLVIFFLLRRTFYLQFSRTLQLDYLFMLFLTWEIIYVTLHKSPVA